MSQASQATRPILRDHLLEAVLDTMPQGISVWDHEHCLLLCNGRYLEMYGFSAEAVRAGISLREVCALSIARSNHLDITPDALLAVFLGRFETARATGEPVITQKPIHDRVIRTSHSYAPGLGWIVVHHDVTVETEQRRLTEEQNARFNAALANMSHGLSMYDAEGRLVISNKRYQEIYRAPDEVCRPGFLYKDIAAMRDSGTSSIPESDEFVRAVLGETSSGNETIEAYRHSDGRVISVRQADISDGGFLRIHQDITTQVQRFETLKQAEVQAAEQNIILRLQNLRFDVAINNMSQGLCMFDSEEKLVVCNDRYARIYNLPPDLMRPGTSLKQIVAYRFDHGMIPKAGRESYLVGRQRLVDEALEARDEIELEDGRTIFVHHQPMRDGGWVATHEDVTEQRRMEARVRHLARHDALTDLPNRTYLHEEVRRLEARIRREATLAVLCLDLDRFKEVNDTLGHAIGDQVLVIVARRLEDCARENDVLARLGGDEFAMIVQSLEDGSGAAALAERLVRSIARPMEIEGHDLSIGVSIGIAIAPGDGEDIETLLRNADLALYRAKAEGRGNYHFFERSMDDALQRRRLLEQGLKGALSRGELHLAYQPLVDLSTDRICSFEALLRWTHPEHGSISPAEFIPVAEETGYIVSIGEWVLREACRFASTWPARLRVAVNLSPVQFKKRGLAEQVGDILADARLDAQRLELEVTESLLLNDNEQTLQTLHRLRAMGVRISMDDFGTGYSSLSYLRSFPFDKIKIDRSFMRDLESRGDSLAIIKAVIGLGHSLGMSTTAEGVETEEQLKAVREQGCNEVQGFLFSHPLAPPQVLELLENEGRPRLKRVS